MFQNCLSFFIIALMACGNISSADQLTSKHKQVNSSPGVKDSLQSESAISKKSQSPRYVEFIDTPKTYKLESGLKLSIDKNVMNISEEGGAQVSNATIIRGKSTSCPAEGFLGRVVSKGIYFTIEQQNCSGWLFIDEFITFRYSAAEHKIVLHKFGLQYMDRSNPDKSIPDKIYTSKHFGKIYFENLKIDSLYELTR